MRQCWPSCLCAKTRAFDGMPLLVASILNSTPGPVQVIYAGQKKKIVFNFVLFFLFFCLFWGRVGRGVWQVFCPYKVNSADFLLLSQNLINQSVWCLLGLDQIWNFRLNAKIVHSYKQIVHLAGQIIHFCGNKSSQNLSRREKRTNMKYGCRTRK